MTVLIGFCSKRAELILAEDGAEAAVSRLRDVARSVHAQDYRITPHGRSRLYELLMGSILDLAGFQKLCFRESGEACSFREGGTGFRHRA